MYTHLHCPAEVWCCWRFGLLLSMSCVHYIVLLILYAPHSVNGKRTGPTHFLLAIWWWFAFAFLHFIPFWLDRFEKFCSIRRHIGWCAYHTNILAYVHANTRNLPKMLRFSVSFSQTENWPIDPLLVLVHNFCYFFSVFCFRLRFLYICIMYFWIR